MTLLVFAHRGEAQAFLTYFPWQPHSSISQLWTYQDYALLICQEGLDKAAISLTQALALLPPCQRVINMGIAAGLDTQVTLDKIYEVRSIYRQQDGEMVFHSFTCEQPGQVDLITTYQRILDPEAAAQLTPFGSLIDREAWKLAQVCQYFKIPFSAYKLISDHPGEGKILCDHIKEMAPHYSQKLLDYYLEKNENAGQQESEVTHDDLPEDWYFTKAQADLFHQYRQKWQRMDYHWEELLQRPDLKEMKSSKKHPKAKTKYLLDQMKYACNPMREQWDQQLEQWSKPFRQVNAQIQFDPQLENNLVRLRAQFSCADDIERLRAALANFDFQALNHFLEGKSLDV